MFFFANANRPNGWLYFVKTIDYVIGCFSTGYEINHAKVQFERFLLHKKKEETPKVGSDLSFHVEEIKEFHENEIDEMAIP